MIERPLPLATSKDSAVVAREPRVQYLVNLALWPGPVENLDHVIQNVTNGNASKVCRTSSDPVRLRGISVHLIDDQSCGTSPMEPPKTRVGVIFIRKSSARSSQGLSRGASSKSAMAVHVGVSELRLSKGDILSVSGGTSRSGFSL